MEGISQTTTHWSDFFIDLLRRFPYLYDSHYLKQHKKRSHDENIQLAEYILQVKDQNEKLISRIEALTLLVMDNSVHNKSVHKHCQQAADATGCVQHTENKADESETIILKFDKADDLHFYHNPT